LLVETDDLAFRRRVDGSFAAVPDQTHGSEVEKLSPVTRTGAYAKYRAKSCAKILRKLTPEQT